MARGRGVNVSFVCVNLEYSQENNDLSGWSKKNPASSLTVRLALKLSEVDTCVRMAVTQGTGREVLSWGTRFGS